MDVHQREELFFGLLTLGKSFLRRALLAVELQSGNTNLVVVNAGDQRVRHFVLFEVELLDCDHLRVVVDQLETRQVPIFTQTDDLVLPESPEIDDFVPRDVLQYADAVDHFSFDASQH
jgi:hypothetical protein